MSKRHSLSETHWTTLFERHSWNGPQGSGPKINQIEKLNQRLVTKCTKQFSKIPEFKLVQTVDYNRLLISQAEDGIRENL